MLSWQIICAVLAWRQGLVSFPQKKTPKIKNNKKIYIQMQNIMIHQFLFINSNPNPLDAPRHLSRKVHSVDGADKLIQHPKD